MGWRCVLCERTEDGAAEPALCDCGAEGSFVRLERRHASRATSAPPPASLADEPERPPRVVSCGHRMTDALLAGGFAVGSATCFYGGAGTGKSTLALGWASALGPAVVCCPEMSRELLSATARRAGADLRRLIRAEPSEWRETATRARARVVLYDSLSRAPRPVALLHELTDWARATDGIALAIAHQSKKGRPLGPVALGHDPDAVLRIARADKRSRFIVLELHKCRWAPVGRSAPFCLV